jgi:hypothetical protein
MIFPLECPQCGGPNCPNSYCLHDGTPTLPTNTSVMSPLAGDDTGEVEPEEEDES